MIDLGDRVRLVTRAEWGARPPRSRTGLTADRVTSHWEGPRMGSFPHSSCAAKVRGIQGYHMDHQGWSDIAYGGIACPHRYVFEGRGPNVRSAANGTTAGNNGANALCYLGGQGDPFTPDGAAAMRVGGDWLTRRGSARDCHRDWKATACPGDVICGWVKAGQPIPSTSTPPPEDDMTPEQAKQLDDTHRWAEEIVTGLRDSHGVAASTGKRVQETTALARSIAQRVDALDLIDASEVAAAVLATLTPQAIADAIPDTLAQDVVDTIVARLND